MSEEKLSTRKIIPFTAMAFTAIITELLPAGVLIEMSEDLKVPVSSIGQLVSFYAIGTVLTAIPAAAILRNISRKPLLIFVLSGFLMSNLITAYSQNFYCIAIVRILVGGFGGILWPLITGYAVRLGSTENTGKALAIVMGREYDCTLYWFANSNFSRSAHRLERSIYLPLNYYFNNIMLDNL